MAKMSRNPRAKNVDNFTVKGMISNAMSQLDAETAALDAAKDTPPMKDPVKDFSTSPVGPGRAERIEAYKREKARRKKVAASKVGPSGSRPVGPGDQATRGRGRGFRSRP